MPAQFCPFCGTPLGGIDAAFCPQCGRQLPAAASDATTPATPQPSGPAATTPPQQAPSYAPPPAPGAYAPPPPSPYAAPPAPPYAGSPAAPPPQYAAPGAYAPTPQYAVMAPRYALPAPGGPVTSGRAIGVTAGAAGVALVVSLLTATPAYRIGAGYILSVALATLPWVFAGAFWLAIGRLARDSFWQVVGECAALAFVGLLVLPTLDALVVGALLGFGSPANAVTWLLPIPPSKYVILLIVTAIVAFGAAGLAWGFAGWPQLRAAHIPISPAASLLLPAGVTAGLFVLTDVLFLLLAYRVHVIPYVFRLDFVLTLILVVLPGVAIAILGGLITYNALRRQSASAPAAMAPAAAPYPAAPPSGAPR